MFNTPALSAGRNRDEGIIMSIRLMGKTVWKHLALAGAAGLMSVAMSAPSAAQTLRMGTTAGAPLGIDGYCGELLPLVAAKAGLTAALAPTTFSITDMFTALAGNQVDIICSPPQANAARRNMGIAFTSPIFINTETMVVLAADTAVYTGWADLRGQAVGANQGAASYLTLVGGAGVTDVRLYPTDVAALAALAAGEVKAVILPDPAMRYELAHGMYPTLRVVDSYVSVLRSLAALAVRDTEFELLGRLQAALEELKADGTIAALAAGWDLLPPPDL